MGRAHCRLARRGFGTRRFARTATRRAESAGNKLGEPCLVQREKTRAFIGKLQRIRRKIAERQVIAAFYDEGLNDFKNLSALKIPAEGTCNYYKYIAVLKQKRDRKELKAQLRKQYGVSLAGEVYEAPLHQQPVFEPFAAGTLPVSEDLCSRHICLPIFSGMQSEDARQVLDALKEVIE